ncbi:hypothetical protein [Aquaspirillum soli]
MYFSDSGFSIIEFDKIFFEMVNVDWLGPVFFSNSLDSNLEKGITLNFSFSFSKESSLFLPFNNGQRLSISKIFPFLTDLKSHCFEIKSKRIFSIGAFIHWRWQAKTIPRRCTLIDHDVMSIQPASTKHSVKNLPFIDCKRYGFPFRQGFSLLDIKKYNSSCVGSCQPFKLAQYAVEMQSLPPCKV